MKKLSTLSLAILSAIALEGCASSTTVRVTEINTYSHTQDVRIRSYGAANMQTLGPVFVKTEDRCSVSDVAKAATVKFKNVSDLVNIRMEETEVKNNSGSTFSCKLSALAVNYRSISAEELLKWKELYNKNTTTPEPVEEEPAPQEEPEEPVEENTTETNNDSFYTR